MVFKNNCPPHAIQDIVTISGDNVINLNLFIGFLDILDFLDLQKAFVTVSKNILLTKLEHHGICSFVNLLIKSFLNRKQHTKLNQLSSKTLCR